MATVDLTLQQILDAVEQLSPAEKKRLQRELDRSEVADKLDVGIKQMPRRRARRMSELLLKANAGEFTSKEDTELGALVDDFESLTLENAQALLEGKSRKAGSSRSAKR